MTETPPDVTAVAVVPADDEAAAVLAVERLLGPLAAPEAGRFEAVAVLRGAGSDGVREALDRLAGKHPEAFRQVPSEASDGAAVNAALEAAHGRYVCLLGAEDRPDPETLDRLVRAADDAGADVLVCGGTGDGDVHADRLAAAKWFRREHIESEGLRFCEDADLGAHERFALRAMATAAKVAVVDEPALAHAPRPEASPPAWLTAAERLAALADELHAAGLLDDDEYDAILERVFAREAAAALDPRALGLDAFERAEHWRAAADFADARLTEAIRHRLPVDVRVRVSLAQHRDLELLEAALAERAPRLLLEGSRRYVRYAGFREAGRPAVPDAWFEAAGDGDAAERITELLARGIEARYLVWTGVKRADYRIEYSFALPVEGLDPGAVRVGAVRIAEGGHPAPRTAYAAADAPAAEIDADADVRTAGGAALVTARLLLQDLVTRPIGAWSLRAAVRVGDVVHDLPLTMPEGYVSKEGMLRGVTVEQGRAEPGSARALVIVVRQRATRRGVARLKGLLSDKLLDDSTSPVGSENRT